MSPTSLPDTVTVEVDGRSKITGRKVVHRPSKKSASYPRTLGIQKKKKRIITGTAQLMRKLLSWGPLVVFLTFTPPLLTMAVMIL